MPTRDHACEIAEVGSRKAGPGDESGSSREVRRGGQRRMPGRAWRSAFPGRAWEREEDAAPLVPRLCPEHVPYLLAGHRGLFPNCAGGRWAIHSGASRRVAPKGQTTNSRGFEPTVTVSRTPAKWTLEGSTNVIPGGYDWSTPSGSYKIIGWVLLPTG